MKLTCLCLTFNEESRITRFLSHALRWADEVLVVDKGSTDQTRKIASKMGARVEQVPFSRQGYEDHRQLQSLSSNDWILQLTPGEIPTPGFVRKVKEVLLTPESEKVDVVCFPVKLYSFGVHLEGAGTPWSIGLQPRMYNRQRCQITNVVHEHVKVTVHSLRIPYDKETYVFHPTHPGFESFMRSHVDYACATSDQTSNKMQTAQRALATAHQYDFNWKLTGQPGLKQSIAWTIYWYMVALACLSKDDEPTVISSYEKIADQMLEDFWINADTNG